MPCTLAEIGCHEVPNDDVIVRLRKNYRHQISLLKAKNECLIINSAIIWGGRAVLKQVGAAGESQPILI